MSKKELDKKRAMEAKRAELIAAGVIKEGEEEPKPMKASHMIRKNKNKDKKKDAT